MNNKAWVIAAWLCALAPAHAQACWAEYAYQDHALVRGHCNENVSLPPAEFEAKMCKPHVQGDEPRKAAQCPASIKRKEGLKVAAYPVAARCLDVRPPGAPGKARFVYYGGEGFSDDRDSLEKLCTAFDGKWRLGAK